MVSVQNRTVTPRSRLPQKVNFSLRPGRQNEIDEIPLARRSVNPPSRRRSRTLIKLSTAVLAFLIFGGLLTFFFGWFRFVPKEAQSSLLTESMGQDERLLGHFAYPEAKIVHLVAVAPGMLLMPDAAKSFIAMQQAAEKDGIPIVILSAYRSLEQQRQLFFDVKAERNQTASDRAKVSAPPGFSEHSTGYAVDLGDLSLPSANLSGSFVNTNAYRWLLKNAARYQYTLSFPEGNAQGVNFEPWHWRFEGSVKALRLFEPAQRLLRSRVPLKNP